MNTHTETNERWTFDEQHTRLRNYEPTQIQSEWWSVVRIGKVFALDIITPPCVNRERNVQIARLIAAAPELLGALELLEHAASLCALADNSESNPEARALRQALILARAAITKATRGQP